MTIGVAACEEAMRTPPRTLAASVAVLALLFALPACTPGPRYCSTASDRFHDGERGFTRENYAEVHPVVAASAVVLAAASLFAGQSCEPPPSDRLAVTTRHPL